MSNYNSENTKVLETYDDNGNLRMLLLHDCGTRHEYVIGSYFTETRYDGALGYERWDYSWDWGHYFSDIVHAVDYWKREVLCNGYDEGTCPHCGQQDDWSDIQWDDPLNGELDAWARCPICNGMHKLVWKLEENIPVEG